MNMKNILILIGFIILNLAVRWISIWGPPLDDDEGIYLLMGRFILEGHLPYVHYWDHQPPLIYYLSAFAQLFSHEQGLAGVRIIAAVFTGTTALILFCLYRILFQSFFYGILCGIVYSLWIYSPGLKGWAFNNEILFNTFTSGSLLILFLNLKKNWRGSQLFFWAGLCMGMGFLTKQNVIFDCVPFMILIGLFKSEFLSSVKNLFYYSLGCILPHMLFALWYMLHGQLSLYLFANLGSNFGYIEYESFDFKHLDYLFDNLKYYLIFIPLSFLARFHFSDTFLMKPRSLGIFFFCWVVSVIYGTTLSKTLYQHYFLQLFPCLCLLTVSVLQRVGFSKSLISFLITALLYIFLSYSFSPLMKQVPRDNLNEKIAAQYINEHKQPGDTLFVFDGNVIFYYLTQMPILTRYAFPAHLIKQKYSYAFKLNQKKEIISVLEQKPSWIILDTGENASYRDSDSAGIQSIFYSVLYKNYTLVHTIKSKNELYCNIQIYKLKFGAI